ncbi:MAG: hypothetical protein M3525_06930 [Acidobacteriota bacterium]|nr:hypothetical protein [Acidobacteriota bacterium]
MGKFHSSKKSSEALLQNGSSQRFIAGRNKTIEANFSNWMKKNNIISRRLKDDLSESRLWKNKKDFILSRQTF